MELVYLCNIFSLIPIPPKNAGIDLILIQMPELVPPYCMIFMFICMHTLTQWHRKLFSTGGEFTLSGHNFYGENYIPMEGDKKLGGHQPPLPPGSYAYAHTRNL